MSKISKEQEYKIKANVLDHLIKHLIDRTDVQNIDIMNLAGFCRNCLSRWYQESSIELGEEISKHEAREIIYGMPHEEWKEKYQK